MLINIMLSNLMLSVIVLSNIMLSVFILSNNMLSVIMLSNIMLSVLVPYKKISTHNGSPQQSGFTITETFFSLLTEHASLPGTSDSSNKLRLLLSKVT